MLCDGSPDPKVAKEINTYINLWREDTDGKPVHKTIQECHDALKVYENLFCSIHSQLLTSKASTPMLNIHAMQSKICKRVKYVSSNVFTIL